MSQLNLENIGNIAHNYVHKPHIVEPHGLVYYPREAPELVLKLYEMYPEGRPLPVRLIGDSRVFLEDEIANSNLSPELGFGFAIVSDGVLNAARWAEYGHEPIVLKNRVYTFQNNDLGTAVRQPDIEDIGAFCVWELGVVGHEKAVWLRFLEEVHKTVHANRVHIKLRYIQSCLQGRVCSPEN
ncbi:MAG: hypothetical protein V1659_00985 [Candidatus Woesearchaeota archaeon]